MSEIPKINFSRIDFPSDALSIKSLRRAHSPEFDVDIEPGFFLGDKGHGPDILTDLLQIEHLIAEAAYCRSMGIPPRESLDEDYIEELSRIYIKYGIASGQHHVEQLIRSIETQATGQARQHLPPHS
jgi:hypothetical protein